MSISFISFQPVTEAYSEPNTNETIGYIPEKLTKVIIPLLENEIVLIVKTEVTEVNIPVMHYKGK